MPPSLRYFCLVAWMDQDSMNSVKQCNVGKHKACSLFPPSPYIWIWIAFLNIILVIFLTLQYKNQYKYRIMIFWLFFFIKHVHSPGYENYKIVMIVFFVWNLKKIAMPYDTKFRFNPLPKHKIVSQLVAKMCKYLQW